jgi:hypothetical protein
MDPPATHLDPRIDHHALADLEAGHAVSQLFHDAGSIGTEDARLGNGWEALADPDVEMVQRRGAEAYEHLAGPGLRIRRFLEHEHLGPAVLVDPNRAHRGRLSA